MHALRAQRGAIVPRVRRNGTRIHLKGAARAASFELKGPPPAYDLQQDAVPTTERFVKQHYPDLIDLVRDGSLLVYLRPDNYVERRADGYREPEQIFMLGTAHISSKSAVDAARVIDAVAPDIVVVELCRSRASLLDPVTAASSNPFSMSDARAACLLSTKDAVLPVSVVGGCAYLSESLLKSTQRSMSLGGPTALLLRAVLGGLYKRAAAATDVKAGAEFVAASDAAKRVGAEIVLGDRPIEITLQRCWEAFTWRRRLELIVALGALLTSKQWDDFKDNVQQARIEEMKQRVNVDAATAQLAADLPELVQPLVHERDLYLSWSMKRSKAANGTKRVVAVLGAGHLRGVMHAIVHETGAQLRFRDLVGGRNTQAFKAQRTRRLVADLLRDTALFSALAWAWCTWSPLLAAQ